MKKLFFSVVAAVLAVGACLANDKPLKISVFSGLIDKVARERKVSTEQAAVLLKDAGVSGFDSDYRNPRLEQMNATVLKPINLYGFPHFLGADNGAKDIEDFIGTAVKYGVPRIMVVPDSFTEGGDKEAEYLKIRDGIKALVAKGKEKGVTVTIEDFGGVKNPCSYASYLKRFLTDIPDLCFALDSGNQYFAGRGDDIRDMLVFAKDRIRHVHLKDQSKEDNHKYSSLGLGNVPNAELVRGVRKLGYDGWYTLENPIGPDHLEDVHRQVGVLRYWCR